MILWSKYVFQSVVDSQSASWIDLDLVAAKYDDP